MDYKTQFLEFAIEQGVLRFGRFTLKSGRISPYFFNAGLFNQGATLAKLSQFYAQAVQASEVEFDMLFGPAYKGIPLVTATAIAFSEHYAKDCPYAFNRKEVKSYGEGGNIIGAPLSGKVMIIDDVITAGTAIREAIELIHAEGAEPVGVAIALDRQERGQDKNSAIQEVEQKLGLKVVSIVRLEDLVAYVGKKPELADQLGAIKAYQQAYGV